MMVTGIAQKEEHITAVPGHLGPSHPGTSWTKSFVYLGTSACVSQDSDNL